MIIIGVDPGLATVGFGVIKIKKRGSPKFKYIDHGTIETKPSLPPEERLRQLNNRLSKLIKKYKANALAVEELFFFKNMKTAIPVSQAKGVILLTAAKNKIPVFQFAPLQVKSDITNNGRAKKEKMQKKVKKMLGLKKIPKPDDAADALAVAVCCALKMKMKKQKRT